MNNFRVHGVTPGYVRDLQALGVRGITADQLTNAALHEVSVAFARNIAAAGFPRTSLADLVQMRIFDVTPGEAARLRRAQGAITPSQLINAKIHGEARDERDDP